ncbi:ABC transporter DevC-family permease protein [Octadecabacter antarcticus 307]|uniref:ABC transporter DevC-family permease protein n=1 Tax=Octadecabacter antarcticus 307 TaxID=391626 RepID=M9RBW6_9RHOB|nr:biotin/lipoyl-binding protein [Octadecabacter antarcticus]AGI69258.1 ABC transporter DevC-family permease protein [Octadecabacter antarcticus 307]
MSDQPTSTIALPLDDNGTAKPIERIARSTTIWSYWFVVPLVFVTLFTGAVIGMYFQPPGLRVFFNATGLEAGAGTQTPIALAIAQVQTQEQVAVLSEGDVVALGRIIPFGDVSSVATPSGAGDARIAEIRVSVGDVVDAGDILAVLDNLPQLQSAVASANANVTVRDANLVQTRAAIIASRAEAQASLERAQATAIAAHADLERTTSLFERGVTTRAAFDQIIARASETQRDEVRAIATLSRYETGSQIVQADIAVAQANLAAARADLNRAELDLGRAYVRAPKRATVLDINARVGESPPSGGMIDLGDTSRMTVEAEVYQTLIGRVTIGDPVVISTAALSQDLTGVVSAIGLEIGRQSITSSDPAANTDARVVDVIVILDAPSSERARTFTNLEAIVRIDAGRSE